MGYDWMFRAWEKYSGGINNLSWSEYEIPDKCKGNNLLYLEHQTFTKDRSDFSFGWFNVNIRHNDETRFSERIQIVNHIVIL